MKYPKVIELYNQRLLTNDQLAEFYGTTPTRIAQNFNYHKDKFIEGKHYYRLEGNELRDFKSQLGNSELPINKFVSQLILYTKQGASRHSKMLGTDQAWDMFDELEENYFSPPRIQLPTSARDLAKLALVANEETNERIDNINGRLVDIEENKLISTEDKDSIDRMVRRKVAIICREQHFGQEEKKLLFQDIGSSIKQLFNVPNRGRIKDKDFQRAIDFINNWEPSSVTKEQVRQLRVGDHDGGDC